MMKPGKAFQWGSNKVDPFANYIPEILLYIGVGLMVVTYGIGLVLYHAIKWFFGVICGGAVATTRTICYLKWLWIILLVAVGVIAHFCLIYWLCTVYGTLLIVSLFLGIAIIIGIILSIHSNRKKKYRQGNKRRKPLHNK